MVEIKSRFDQKVNKWGKYKNIRKCARNDKNTQGGLENQEFGVILCKNNKQSFYKNF